MDTDLYDEFGNYIGPDLLSDEEEVDEDVESSQEEGKSDEEGDLDHAAVVGSDEPTEESLAVSFEVTVIDCFIYLLCFRGLVVNLFSLRNTATCFYSFDEN